MKRVGIVIKIRPERLEEYKAVHADSHAGVRDLLQAAHIHSFVIFHKQLDDGNHYLFGSYEYTGDNYERDMADLAAHPRNIEWLAMCDPMQEPLPGEKSWSVMEQIYYND
jgi:L-rhamnose mutarotase